MISTMDNNRVLKKRKGIHFSLRKRAEKLFGFLAILSIALNFMVPVTHGLLSSAQAAEFLEICTNQGIQIVKVELSQENAEKLDEMNDACNACPDCPLCQFGKSDIHHFPDQQKSHPLLSMAEKGSIAPSAVKLTDGPPWSRPALRAPPFV